MSEKSWTPEQLAKHIADICGPVVTSMLEPLQKQLTDHGSFISASQSRANHDDPAAQRTIETKGLMVGGIIATMAARKVLGCDVMKYAKGEVKGPRGALIKAQPMEVIKALEASTITDGGALIEDEVSSDFIDLLTPRAVVRSFGTPVMPMSSGTMTIPKLTAAAAAYYIGESKDAVKSQQSFGIKKLTARKLAALVPISQDLIRRGGPRVNSLVRNDTLRAVSLKEDVTFIRSQGTEFSPKGLRYLASAANVIAQTGGASYTLATVTADLGNLLLALEEANVAFTNPGWILAPRVAMYLMTKRDGNGNYAFRAEMMTGKLWGYPFRKTTSIPRNLGSGNKSEIYLADFDDVVIGQTMSLDVAVSAEASYKDENGDLVSAFSLDQIVMRVLTEHDLALRHDESVAVLKDVEWAPGGGS